MVQNDAPPALASEARPAGGTCILLVREVLPPFSYT